MAKGKRSDKSKGNGRGNGKYRSGLEQRLFEGPLKGVPYEPKTFKYTAVEERKYTPDGVLSDDVLLEVKGRFRTRAEARKYLHFQKCYPDKYIIFVLHSRNVALPGAKTRKKDGKRKTHEDWLTENGFLYCYEDTVEFFLKSCYPELMKDTIPSIKEVKWKKKPKS